MDVTQQQETSPRRNVGKERGDGERVGDQRGTVVVPRHESLAD